MFGQIRVQDLDPGLFNQTLVQLDSENTILKGSITVWLTSYLFCLDSAAFLMLNEQQFYLFGQIQASQTGGQPYSDTSPILSVL